MKEMICIICPNSCRLKVQETLEGILVEGARCSRGRDFALQEIQQPKRSLCTTVKTVFPDYPVLSVRSKTEFDRRLVFPMMKEINRFVLEKPVQIGDIIIPNILESGVDIIATSEIN